MSSPIGATSRFRIFVGLTSALLCHLRFPTADSSSSDPHRSHDWSLLILLLGSSRNWKCCFQERLGQVHSFRTNSPISRAVHGNHVTTVMSEVEILSSFARDLSNTAQRFVYTNESSIKRSEQSVFILSLKLPSSSIRKPFTAGSPIKPSISWSIWTKVQWKCVHCSSCVQVHLHPFRLLRTACGPDIQTSKRKWAFGSVMRLFPTFVPSNRTPVMIPHIESPAIVPFFTDPTLVPVSVWGTCLSRFLFRSLSLIPSFQDLRDQLSMCCPRKRLWHLCSHFCILWFFPCVLCSYLCPHSWTMTCSVWICQTIACLCSGVHCSLVENVLQRTWNTHDADSMTLFLCQTRENWPHQHPWNLSVHENPSHSAWNHESWNQTSPQMFASDSRCSSSSGTNDSSPASLISSNLSFIFFSKRDT